MYRDARRQRAANRHHNLLWTAVLLACLVLFAFFVAGYVTQLDAFAQGLSWLSA